MENPNRKRPVSIDHVANIVGVVGEATDSERAAGLTWYPAFGKAIVDYGRAYGLDRKQSIALFAALSPQARISRNWHNFQVACQDGNPARCVCLPGTQRAKVARFLAGLSSIADATKGDKVRAFYANLSGDESQVTVDRHAAAAALGACPDNARISPRAYKQYALEYQAAAHMLDLTPAQTQAIAWIVWRRKKGIKDEGGIHLLP